jgi:hypothetical protein
VGVSINFSFFDEKLVVITRDLTHKSLCLYSRIWHKSGIKEKTTYNFHRKWLIFKLPLLTKDAAIMLGLSM